MFGLDRFSVFVDKRPLNTNIIANTNNQLLSNSTIINSVLPNLQNKIRLNEYNLCNFVTRNNYAIFQTQIHLQCTKPLQGKFLYIQADGRTNRWSKLFSAVLCEVEVYEGYN
jgi:hypothetical protein